MGVALILVPTVALAALLLKIWQVGGSSLDYLAVLLNFICCCLACSLYFGGLVTFDHGFATFVSTMVLQPPTFIFSILRLRHRSSPDSD